jgi:hypothetical protein
MYLLYGSRKAMTLHVFVNIVWRQGPSLGGGVMSYTSDLDMFKNSPEFRERGILSVKLLWAVTLPDEA